MSHQSSSLGGAAGGQMLPSHTIYLHTTRWGNLAKAPASLRVMSWERYLTPAPNDTTTKPWSAVSFTHASNSCGNETGRWVKKPHQWKGSTKTAFFNRRTNQKGDNTSAKVFPGNDSTFNWTCTVFSDVHTSGVLLMMMMIIL